MTDPMKAFLQAVSLTAPVFPPNSRYYGLETSTWTRSDGSVVAYVIRRFVPAPERFVTLREHAVAEGDRLDNLAARYLGDPELFWRICDANGAMRPDELVEAVGTRLRITLPEGVAGGSVA